MKQQEQPHFAEGCFCYTEIMIKVLELFAGIGACSKALMNLKIDHKIVDAVEIDQYAIKSFNAVHGTNFSPQDITKWDKDIKVDLIMHGSPCQDFSVAGKEAGGDEGSGTRSSLLYETIRIVKKTQPEIVIWENVRNLLSKKHRHNWEAYVERMKNLGYESTAMIMNAKDYGVPQNRERVFTVSIKKDNNLIDSFEWPQKQKLERKLKDLLEKKPDKKYYLSSAMMNYFMGVNQKPSKYPRKERFLQNINRKNQDVANSVTTNAGNRPTDNFVKEQKTVRIKTANKRGYDIATDGDGIDIAYPSSTTRRGRVGHGVSKTIQTVDIQAVLDGCKIRKLTPLECWRLMGFSDKDFEKAKKVNSNTQLYKQAGNSIVVDCLMSIIKGIKWRTQ